MSTLTTRFACSALSICSALFVVGCSNSGDPPERSAPAPSVSSVLSPYAVQQTKEKFEKDAKVAAALAKQASLPTPDPNTPDSSYLPINNADQLMFLYAANSGLPADYQSMAENFSEDYRNIRDTFRKRDLLTALTPKLDDKIADAKAHPYLLWTDSSPGLDHYDFNRKGFAVNTALLSGSGFGYISNMYGRNHQIAFSNGEDFQFLPVADETTAREIESMIGNYNAHLELKIFAFAQSTDDNQHAVLAKITRIQLVGKGNRMLAEHAAP